MKFWNDLEIVPVNSYECQSNRIHYYIYIIFLFIYKYTYIYIRIYILHHNQFLSGPMLLKFAVEQKAWLAPFQLSNKTSSISRRWPLQYT